MGHPPGGQEEGLGGVQTQEATMKLGEGCAGWAISEVAKKRGLVEDLRLGLEVVVGVVFDGLRWMVRRAVFMPPPPSGPSVLPAISRRERAAAHARAVRPSGPPPPPPPRALCVYRATQVNVWAGWCHGRRCSMLQG
jgi:hypothetical protein